MKIKRLFETKEKEKKPLKKVCSWCKKTQKEDGTWIDDAENSNSKPENERVSHGICPACNEKHWSKK